MDDLKTLLRQSYALVLVDFRTRTNRARVAPRDDRLRVFHIRFAHARIRDHIRRTPILETASPVAGAPSLSLKLECFQVTGLFKARGAFHNLLTRPASAAGCATARRQSGAAVAFAARKLGIKARVFVPEIASPAKIAKIKAYGAEAVIGGAPTPRRRSAATPMSRRAARS